MLKSSSIARGPTTGNTFAAGVPHAYVYGYGSHARLYRAYGYGHGYRNRYYGGRYGYGRSQAYSRAIVARLRSVHRGLAQLDHDYLGHRARAMHAISMAIRQLSHRSMIYRRIGFANGMNGAGFGNGMNNRVAAGQGGLGGGVRGRAQFTQAQSDARMALALRTLQGIQMQLSYQGIATTNQARARGHVQWAIHELSVALRIR
jgi:hypothetical protein